MPVSFRHAPELGIEGLHIWIEARTSDLATAQPGESIAVRGMEYRIKSPPIKGDDGISSIELSIDG